MEYLSELPEVSKIDVEGNVIELELEQEVEKLPRYGDRDQVVLVANCADQIVVTVGRVIKHKTLEGPDVLSQIKIVGLSVSFSHYRA